MAPAVMVQQDQHSEGTKELEEGGAVALAEVLEAVAGGGGFSRVEEENLLDARGAAVVQI
jgi:hypothetical protein